MSVQIIHSMEEFQKAITDTKFKATVVDFTATWCGPCKMISPIFESYSTVYPTVKFIKVDVDENEEIAASAEVSAMPTFLVFKNGKKVDGLIGASQDDLEILVKKYA